MLTFNQIQDALLTNPPTKVAITDGNVTTPIYAAGQSPANPFIWVTPYEGAPFKITEEHTITILT